MISYHMCRTASLVPLSKEKQATSRDYLFVLTYMIYPGIILSRKVAIFKKKVLGWGEWGGGVEELREDEAFFSLLQVRKIT